MSCARVSRAWLHAVRTRQVYDARVASHSTKPLVVWSSTLSDAPRMIHCLSSSREDPLHTEGGMFQLLPACPKLPPLPFFGGQIVCSDGYIYLLGVVESIHSQPCSNKVFVFDVAGGQKEWKECASMNERRREFGCAAMHGKLYVFGGLSPYMYKSYFIPSTFCGCEVYDPKEDRWSPIKPMTTLRYGDGVHIVGNELFVEGGYSFVPNDFRYATKLKDADQSKDDQGDRAGDDVNGGTDKGQSSRDDEDDPEDDVEFDHELDTWCRKRARSLEVYDPVEDEWRMVNPFGRADGNYIYNPNPGRTFSVDYFFAVGGKLYSIAWSSIHVYAGENSWTHLHSCSFPVFFGRDDCVVCLISTVVFINGELLVKADWWNRTRKYHMANEFESRGFCGENKEIIWQEIRRFRTQARSYQSSKLVIQL